MSWKGVVMLTVCSFTLSKLGQISMSVHRSCIRISQEMYLACKGIKGNGQEDAKGTEGTLSLAERQKNS